MRYQKTEWGYIKKKKTALLLITLIFAAAIAAIYFTGYYLNDKSNASVWTIVAVVLVLPAAKLFVNFLVLFPYRTPSGEKYEEISNALKGGSDIWSDLVITSTEKVMNLDFMVISHHAVLAVLGKEKQELNYIQSYLSKGVHNFADGYQVKVYENYEGFLKAVKALDDKEDNGEQKEEAEKYLYSLIA